MENLAGLVLFFQGFMIGFTLAIPVGPMAIFCINRSIALGMMGGLCAGIGTAISDGIFSGVAGFGLACVECWILEYGIYFKLTGAAILTYIGVEIIKKPYTEDNSHMPKASGYAATLSQAFLLNLVSPFTILTFISMFTATQVKASNAYDISMLVTGCAAGSLSWWVILSSLISVVRTKMSARLIWFINKISGALIIGIAASILFV